MLSTFWYILWGIMIAYGIFFDADLFFDIFSICLIAWPLIHATVCTIRLASRKFRCEKCGHEFKMKRSLLFHACIPLRIPYMMKGEHPERLRGFDVAGIQCPECGCCCGVTSEKVEK